MDTRFGVEDAEGCGAGEREIETVADAEVRKSLERSNCRCVVDGDLHARRCGVETASAAVGVAYTA